MKLSTIIGLGLGALLLAGCAGVSASRHLSRANEYYHKGDFNQAMIEYNTAVAKNPKSDEALLARGCCLLQTSHPDSALADFDSVLALNPNNAWGYYYRSAIYSEQGDFVVACKELDQAISLKADIPAFYALRYRVEKAAIGDSIAVPDTAGVLNPMIRDLNTLTQLCPDKLLFYIELVDLHSQAEQFDQAAFESDRLLQAFSKLEHPNTLDSNYVATAKYYLAIYNFKLKTSDRNPELSLRYLDEITADSKSDNILPLYVLRAQILCSLERYQECIDTCSPGLASDNDEDREIIALLLAKSYYMIGNKATARGVLTGVMGDKTPAYIMQNYAGRFGVSEEDIENLLSGE